MKQRKKNRAHADVSRALSRTKPSRLTCECLPCRISRFVIVVALVCVMAFFNEVAVLKSITKVNENIAKEQEHSLKKKP